MAFKKPAKGKGRSFSSDKGAGRPSRPRTGSSSRSRDDDRPSRSFGDRSSRPGRPYKPRGEEGSGERRPFRASGGEGKRPFRPRGEEGSGERRPFRAPGGESRRPFRPRGEEGSGERRPFRPSGGEGKRPYPRRGDAPERGQEDRKKSAFYGKPFGPSSRKSGGNREEGERKSFVKSRLSRQRKFMDEQPGAEKKAGSDLVRLNKFISNSGICSRREADNLITMGLISVNGAVITELGYKVKRTDDVRYESKKLTAEKPVYILLNKPKGFITTTDDPQERNTVMNLIAGACKERVYPVGRLDRNTTGLLLFTNDGELADRLTHPSYNVRKIYKVELDRPITHADFEKIKEGVRLEEGRAVVDDLAIVDDDKKTLGIELHIGWNRIVRRIFEALDYQVMRLDRVVYAGLDKKDLPRGNWRFLKDTEVVKLKHFGK
ncbi:MAG: pseudouridine synthase [Bacteroidota bacterium]